MRHLFGSPIPALALGAALMSGCRSGRPDPSTTTPPVMPASGVDPAAIERARADSIRYPYTAADIRFMSAMIGHHAQALVMAGLAPRNGASAPIRRLSERIINAQQDEIALMQQWLRERRQPVPDAGTAGAMAHGDHAMHGSAMPGMLTAAQLKQLEEARGPEFDRLFLTFMIQHHRGAVAMVEELFRTPGAAHDLTVFKLANDVSVDQSTEVDRMAQMLAELIFNRPPP